jgi:hypothetical protein
VRHHDVRRPARLLSASVLLLTLLGCGGGDGSSDDAPEVVVTPTTGATPATPAPPPASGGLDVAFGAGGLAVVPFGTIVDVPPRGLHVESDGTTRVLVTTFRGDEVVRRARLNEVVVDAEGRVDPPGVSPLTPVVVDVQTAAYTPTGAVLVAFRRSAATVHLQRLTDARAPDPSFGEAGVVTLHIEEVVDVVPTEDGGVLVVGRFDSRSAIWRFDVSGARDLTFGDAGTVRGPAPFRDVRTIFTNAAVGRDGRVVVAAVTGFGTQAAVFAYDGHGILDPSFGDGGRVAPNSGSPSAIALLDSGAVVIADRSGLARIGPRGVVDESYGERAREAAAPFVATSDGTVTGVSGTFVADEPRRFDCSTSSGGACLRLALVVRRVLPDGAADPRFGDEGAVVTDLAPYGAQDTGYEAIVLGPAGRITAAGGACRAPLGCDLVIGRYLDQAE